MKIKTLRAYLNLSQAAFAEPLGLSPTHIARFEKGISELSKDIIDLICEKYGVDPRYFTDPQLPVEQAVKKITEEEKNRVIGKRLCSARSSKGWSQNELAKRSGVNQATVNRVEAGAKLTEKAGRKLAEALEVGVEWLMDGISSRRDCIRIPEVRKMRACIAVQQLRARDS